MLSILLSKAAVSPAGGRVTGSNIISDLIQELHASVEAASQFEGEMQMLEGYSRYLGPGLTPFPASPLLLE